MLVHHRIRALEVSLIYLKEHTGGFGSHFNANLKVRYRFRGRHGQFLALQHIQPFTRYTDDRFSIFPHFQQIDDLLNVIIFFLTISENHGNVPTLTLTVRGWRRYAENLNASLTVLSAMWTYNEIDRNSHIHLAAVRSHNFFGKSEEVVFH